MSTIELYSALCRKDVNFHADSGHLYTCSCTSLHMLGFLKELSAGKQPVLQPNQSNFN